MMLLLVLVSVVSFIVIQLPPGDYLTTMLNRFDAMGIETTDKLVRALERQYGLNLPLHMQYVTWMGNLLRGDMGKSFFWNEPVLDLLLDRLPLTILISLLSLGFVYVVAIPIGIYSATHQYSVTDYAVTVVGFVGLATPNFLLALVLMFVLFKGFGLSPGGLFSPEFELAAWSVGKLWMPAPWRSRARRSPTSTRVLTIIAASAPRGWARRAGAPAARTSIGPLRGVNGSPLTTLSRPAKRRWPTSTAPCPAPNLRT